VTDNVYGVSLKSDDVLFRDEVRAFLRDELTPRYLDGSLDPMERQREWQHTLNVAGFAAISWPTRYGGRSASPVQQLIFSTELAKSRAPEPINRSAVNQLGPTIIQWGTQQQRDYYLPRILSGADVWCQGFSEPDAGSDLASLRTRAVPDGEHFVVDGQKIWTSKAHYADWIYILARTDAGVPKHEGISFLLVDLRSPGIEIRPIRQISGAHDFNEVRFSGVRVPIDNLVGLLNNGWQVATSTLGYERVGQSKTHRIERRLDHLVRQAAATDGTGWSPLEDAVIRDRIVRFAARVEALRFIGAQATAAGVRGEDPAPAASVAKLLTSEVDQAMSEFGLDLAGASGTLERGSLGAAKKGAIATSYLLMRAATLGAGTSEIQRNLIGEKLLGLPRDH
jgi:alkylation response protein AidB-like acyl-CoA dehydrogenase